jgi:hypothetical protein
MDLDALLLDAARDVEGGLVLPAFLVLGARDVRALATPRGWPDEAEGRREAARDLGAWLERRRRRTVAVALACAAVFDERAKGIPLGGAKEGATVVAGTPDGRRGIALGWREGGGWRWLRSGDVDDVMNDPLPDLTLPPGEERPDLVTALFAGMSQRER